jgi:hypothetical protein
MALLQISPSVWARETELRRETIAVMRVRLSFDPRIRPIRTSSQDDAWQLADAAAMSAESPSVRILSICDYDGLRVSREWLLDREGYSTESHTSSDPLDAYALESFRLAILCHSVAPEQAIRIADLLHRRNRRIFVVRMSVASDRAHSPSFDAEFDGFAQPDRLLAFIREAVARLPGAHLRG